MKILINIFSMTTFLPTSRILDFSYNCLQVKKLRVYVIISKKTKTTKNKNKQRKLKQLFTN